MKFFVCSITIHDRNTAYKKVSNVLHKFAESIKLRVGYPLPEKNISIIFLVVELSNDQAGAFSGTLGQIPSVKVSINPIKM